MSKLIDAARELWDTRISWDKSDDEINAQAIATFAEQQIALAVAEAVKVERKRVLASILNRNTDMWTWYETEFEKEIQANGK